MPFSIGASGSAVKSQIQDDPDAQEFANQELPRIETGFLADE